MSDAEQGLEFLSAMNKDAPFPKDATRDLKFRMAMEAAITETREAWQTGTAFNGRDAAPLQGSSSAP